MKAFLLAAGFGTRLRPLTDTIPKCMVPVHEKPLLEWWLDLLLRHGVSEVLINTHYLPGPVRDFIAGYNARKSGLNAVEFYEPTLLGSGGTIRANRGFVDRDEPFFICYADNLTNMDLTALRAEHEADGGVLTMALFRTNKPRECGIAELDSRGKVVDFVEKPPTPQSNLANAGVYAAGHGIFDYLPDDAFVDFGKDVLPKLVGKMRGWETKSYIIDIGTMDNYERAQKEWKS
jgi:mannose-1-phosphate guanylyltransferase